MPWKIFVENDEHCVFKVTADGQKTGKALGCHTAKKGATDQLQALNANVSEYGNSLDDFTSKVRRAFNTTFESPLTGEMNIWVVDVFPEHVVAREGNTYHKIAMPQTDPTVTFAPRDQWEVVQLDYVPVAETLDTESFQITFVSEFSATAPDVPLAPGVDKALLEQTVDGQPDLSPMYLTLKVAEAGAVSGNKFRHTPELVSAVVEQINTVKPSGIMGHIRPEERSTAFPVADIHWVGAIEVDGAAYAKGYIPAGRAEVREQYRAEKAKGGKAATSLFGGGPKKTLNNGEWTATPFRLDSLDLAPWSRAAWPSTGEFALTAETLDPTLQSEAVEQENTMPDEIKWDEIKYADLPAEVVEMVLAENKPDDPPPAPPAEPDQALVTELQGVKDANTTLTTQVKEMSDELAARRQREFEQTIDAIVAEFTKWDTAGHEAAETAVENLRTSFRAAVVAEFTNTRGQDTPPELSTVAETVWESSFTGLASMVRDLVAGGSARVGRSRRQTDVETPNADETQKAMAAFGIGSG